MGHLLVWNLLNRRKPFVVLDWRKNYRHFLNRPEGKCILVFALGEDESLSFNPLYPSRNLSENQRQAYLRDMISVIAITYLPSHHLLSTRGVEYLLLRALDFFDDQKPVTFNDIRHHIENCKAHSRERDWKISALSVLFKLTTGPIGRLMNSEGPTTIQDILDKPVIMELDGIGSESDRSVFTQSLLLWLYYYRLSEGRTTPFKHVLFIEEAHSFFLRHTTPGHGIHDLMLRQIRDLEQSMMLFDQNPSLLSTPALGNSGVTICLNLKHSADIQEAAKSLPLPSEKWDFLGRLPVGYRIVKVQDRWDRPFLVHFLRFPVCDSLQLSGTKRDNAKGDSCRNLSRSCIQL